MIGEEVEYLDLYEVSMAGPRCGPRFPDLGLKLPLW